MKTINPDLRTLLSAAILSGLLALTAGPARSETPAPAAPAAPAPAAPAAPAAKPGETELKADRMEMDFKSGQAVFTGNVRVTDGTMILQADSMTVDFTPDNQLKRVDAKGNVLIVQPDKQRRATAGHALYDVATGTVTLDDKPRLQMEKHSMEGAERIVYNRDTEKVTTEGTGTVIRVVTDGSQSPMNLLGERKKE